MVDDTTMHQQGFESAEPEADHVRGARQSQERRRDEGRDAYRRSESERPAPESGKRRPNKDEREEDRDGARLEAASIEEALDKLQADPEEGLSDDESEGMPLELAEGSARG